MRAALLRGLAALPSILKKCTGRAAAGSLHRSNSSHRSLRLTRRLGWTLVEMVLVVAIVGTLTAIALPALHDAVEQAKIAKAIGDIDAMQIDLAAYSPDGSLPETLAGIDRAGYLDPWGNPYQYLDFATAGGGKGGKGGKGTPMDWPVKRYLSSRASSRYPMFSTPSVRIVPIERGGSRAPR